MSLFIIKQILISVSRKGYHGINTENGNKEEFREEECLCRGVSQQVKKKKNSVDVFKIVIRDSEGFVFRSCFCHNFSQRPLAIDIRKKE